MGSQPARAMGGSCLGSLLGLLLGLFLGGIAGNLWGWSHAPADLRPERGPGSTTYTPWSVGYPFSSCTILGGLTGIVAGAISRCRPGHSQSQEDILPSVMGSSDWKGDSFRPELD